MLLALDTATDAVTVALHDGARVVASSHSPDRLRHGELLAPAIRDVLDRAGVSATNLTRIAVGVGPGPYTGLRIGLVTATSMGTVLGVPVVGVRTPDIVSFEVSASGPFVVATDARRREVYWTRYASPGQPVDGPHVDLPSAAGTELPTAGNGPLLYPEAFPHPVEPSLPSAAALANAVAAGAAELLAPRPLYLRRPDAQVPAERKRVT